MLDAIRSFRKDVPEHRKLQRVGNSSGSRSVILPKRVLDFWNEHFGCEVTEVAIWTDGIEIRISPKNPTGSNGDKS